MNRRWTLAFVATLALAALLLAGCGGDDEATLPETVPTTPSTTSEGPPLRVGLVTDIGGLNDRSFNFLANQGLERAKDELGVEGRVVISDSNGDYVPNLSSLARDDYDLVIGVGFLMADAIDTVAKQFPETNFAIIDFGYAGLKSKPMNVRGLLFKEQEAGYLVGYLGALLLKENGDDAMSSVGGQQIPPVDRYIAGYQAGARAAFPEVKLSNNYSQDFVDQAKCKELGLNQIAAGSDIIFQVAGQCGLGALDAAREKQLWGIGVDADQAHLGPHILTSALKKVDVAVFDTVQAVQDGSFKGGEDVTFDVAGGGVGVGQISSEVPEAIIEQLPEVEAEIAAGLEIPDSLG